MQRFPSISKVLVVLVLCSAAAAQTAPSQEATGRVAGHVYCNDTNGPARMARVILEPVSDVHDATQPHYSLERPSTNAVQTGLDGSFTMKDVKPGAYYLIAEMPGYLSSVASLSDEDWGHPTAAVADRMAKILQRVFVEAGRTALVNLSLERGAAVNGTVSFDDGNPAVGVRVKALREKSDGSWETVRLDAIQPFMSTGIVTNDLGQYRIAGLAAGHYVIEASLSISNIRVTGFMGQMSGIEERSQSSLAFFSGGKLKAEKDAAFALAGGESRPGEDILIPLSKLHTVSGTVVTESDGRPARVDKVSLLYADDQKELATAQVDPKSGEYRFYFVPEGHFVLKVEGDLTVFKHADNSAAVYHYGPLQRPLDVNGDVDGFVLALPEPTNKPMTAQNSGQPR